MPTPTLPPSIRPEVNTTKMTILTQWTHTRASPKRFTLLSQSILGEELEAAQWTGPPHVAHLESYSSTGGRAGCRPSPYVNEVKNARQGAAPPAAWYLPRSALRAADAAAADASGVTAEPSCRDAIARYYAADVAAFGSSFAAMQDWGTVAGGRGTRRERRPSRPPDGRGCTLGRGGRGGREVQL